MLQESKLAEITSYQSDIVAWAQQQAHWIRTRQFDKLDVANIAEEIDDVGKSEKRELASRMAVLLAHLLKWQHQPQLQSKSWQRTIHIQRKSIWTNLEDTPSLKSLLNNTRWLQATWDDAVALAIKETQLDSFPETCPWATQDFLQDNWLPLTSDKP
jgi:hypothetical protein